MSAHARNTARRCEKVCFNHIKGGDKAYAAWYNENQVLQKPKQKTKDG